MISLFTECFSLVPDGFFEKNMNISMEALVNYFYFWKKAITSFLNKEYYNHDALVGDNACHIRTYVLLEIALLQDDYFLFHLKKTITTLDWLVNELKGLPITDKNISIKDFLIQQKLVFFIPKEFAGKIKYIIDSYLLTLTKEVLPSTGITLFEKIMYQPVRDWGFSYNRAQYLVRHTQKSFSAESCAYVIAKADHLNIQGLTKLLQIKKDAHGRSFISQFFAAKVLFLRSLHQNHPILLKITRFLDNVSLDKLILFFKPNKEKDDFEPCKSLLNHDLPGIVLEGVVCYKQSPESIEEYKKRLLSHSFFDIILANFAAHPQYSGDLKTRLPPFAEIIEEILHENELEVNATTNCYYNNVHGILAEKNEFEKAKKFSFDTGCSLENPSMLFLNHMYCDRMLSNLIKDGSLFKLENTSTV